MNLGFHKCIFLTDILILLHESYHAVANLRQLGVSGNLDGSGNGALLHLLISVASQLELSFSHKENRGGDCKYRE